MRLNHKNAIIKMDENGYKDMAKNGMGKGDGNG